MLRIRLSGHLNIEAGDLLLRSRDFPGEQGRAAFAFLVGNRSGPVGRATLVDALWPGGPPPASDSALTSLISKLRSLLIRAGMDGPSVLQAGSGCYELRLPPGTWIDHEAAADAIHEAESALRAGEPARAYGPSAIAQHIAARPFLPAQTAAWFDQQRERLESILVRALECRAEVYLWNREYSIAVDTAREAVRLHPFRESAYRLLMRAHAAHGNSAEALRVYESCRTLMASELGVPPSPETKALHGELLQRL